MEFQQFINWERSTRDTIDFKKTYCDLAGGDVLAGLVLSEIIYWYLPNHQGKSKLRIQREGREWIACTRHEWYDRTRLTPRQIDTVLKNLIKMELIEKRVWQFAGVPTTHISLNVDTFMKQWKACIQAPPPNPYTPVEITDSLLPSHQNRQNHITKTGISYTETTTETTDNTYAANAAHGLLPLLQQLDETKISLLQQYMQQLIDGNPLPAAPVQPATPPDDAPQPPAETPQKKQPIWNREKLNAVQDMLAQEGHGIDISALQGKARTSLLGRIGHLVSFLQSFAPDVTPAEIKLFYQWWDEEHDNEPDFVRVNRPLSPTTFNPHFTAWWQARQQRLKRQAERAAAPRRERPVGVFGAVFQSEEN